MKFRAGFVSNSSSSSYVICADLTDAGIRCIPIKSTRLQAVQDWINACGFESCTLDPEKQWYVTRFITEYESDAVYQALDQYEKHEYCGGQTDGTPYDDWEEDEAYSEFYVSKGADYRDHVYIRKEHTDMVSMEDANAVAEFLRQLFPDAKSFDAYRVEDHIEVFPVKHVTDEEDEEQ